MYVGIDEERRVRVGVVFDILKMAKMIESDARHHLSTYVKSRVHLCLTTVILGWVIHHVEAFIDSCVVVQFPMRTALGECTPNTPALPTT